MEKLLKKLGMSQKEDITTVVKEKTTITFITKKNEKIVFDNYDLSINILITDVTYRRGVCKGTICYKKVPNFGTVYTNFHIEYCDKIYVNDFSYECGTNIPYYSYIEEVLSILKERKQLR